MSDPIKEVLDAPAREMKLPELGRIATLRRKHHDLQDQFARANTKREEAIARLRRADDKVRDLRKALVRSTLRMQAEHMLNAIPNAMKDDPL